MSLKDIAKKSESPKKEQTRTGEPSDDYEKLLALSFIEGLNQYLYGMYVTYQKLNNLELLDGEQFILEMKKIPVLNEEKKRKEYLKNNSKIGKFLYWYLYET